MEVLVLGAAAAAFFLGAVELGTFVTYGVVLGYFLGFYLDERALTVILACIGMGVRAWYADRVGDPEYGDAWRALFIACAVLSNIIVFSGHKHPHLLMGSIVTTLMLLHYCDNTRAGVAAAIGPVAILVPMGKLSLTLVTEDVGSI